MEPFEYDEKYEQWSLADLPMSFVPWKKKPTDKTKEQLVKVLALLQKADAVVHAGAPDAEGQLLIDEILQYAGYKKSVQRVLINDNTTAAVKKSLANLRDNAEFAGLSASAEARQIGDQFSGFNMSRLYTLSAKHVGYAGGSLSVGRVQTPILGLVVRRDRENAGHQQSFYYAIKGDFTFSLFVGEVGVKASAVDRNASLTKLEKRLGTYQPNEAAPKMLPAPVKAETPELNQYRAERERYYLAKAETKTALSRRHEQAKKQLSDRQKNQRDEK